MVIAALVLTARPDDDYVAKVVLAIVSLLVFPAGAVGLILGMFGAAKSAAAEDRRVVVMLPVWANAALLLWFAVVMFRPR